MKKTQESAATVLHVAAVGAGPERGVRGPRVLREAVVVPRCCLPWCEDKSAWCMVHQTNLGHLGIARERLVENPFLKWICALVILINFDPLCSF